ncbi:MAG TPA: hypothetical protein PK294_11580 [Ignavibacteria bacterium]|nr:hypothetical protein [Ignavibacteria bacterium]HQY52263.1 hypothetical protein [Ignavibacteria bacterium]HRB01068.1 hypothetical protein [Ignavibacteria bacterium]
MSFIKEIYDVTKDLTNNKIALNKIKRALLTESKLNNKILEDISNKENRPDFKRMSAIVKNLETDEIKAANNCGIPMELLTLKKVTPEMLEDLDYIRAEGFDLETVIEKLFIKIAYLKKDFDSENINLFIRLRNIYSYNLLLQRMLDIKLIKSNG